MSYGNFGLRRSSEKITLCHLNSKRFVFGWTDEGGDIYSAVIPDIVTELHKNYTALTASSTMVGLSTSQFYYDISAKKLYVNDDSITSNEYVATTRHLFSTSPCELSWDLTDDGIVFEYINRLILGSAFNSKVEGSSGVAIIGAGAFRLQNLDGYFNDSFANLIFEGQKCQLYSWARDLPETEAMLIYDGVVSGKDWDNDTINFKISNNLNLLNRNIQSETLTATSYNVTGLVTGNLGIYKSRLWGRVNGLRLVNISALESDRYTLSGTSSITLGGNTVTGTSTNYLSEISSGDTLIINKGVEHLVVEVISNTSLKVEENAASNETGSSECVYKSISPIFNRVHNVSARPLRQTICTIILQPAATIYEVDSVRDLLVGDIVEVRIDSVYYTRTITSIFANNISLNQSVPIALATTNQVIRPPISKMFFLSKEIPLDRNNYLIENSDDHGCYVTVNRQFESVGRNPVTIDLGATWNGTSGTNVVTRSAIDDLLLELVSPRDYLIFGGQKYEVASVTSDTTSTRIRLVTNLAVGVSSPGIRLIKITPITNDVYLSADVIGETENGLSSGVWINTGMQFIKQQLLEAGFGGNIDNSFDLLASENRQIVSLVAPISPAQKNMPKLLTLLNEVNESLSGTLFVKNDFKFSYKIFDLSRDFEVMPIYLTDYDVISWGSKIERNSLYREVNVSYDHRQLDAAVNTDSKQVFFRADDFNILLDSSATYEMKSSFLNLDDARAVANRKLLMSQYLNTVLQCRVDNRYYNLNLLDVVKVTFKNLPRTFLDVTDNSRFMLVIELKKSGEEIGLVLADLGNTFARRAIITPDTAGEYSVSNDDDILDYSFITDDLGVTETDGLSKGKNLIF